MNKKYSVFLWLVLALSSCNKSNSPSTPSDGDVYIIGAGTLNSHTIGRYWKNNNPFDLPYSSEGSHGEHSGSTTGIAVSGNDLYICGNEISVQNFRGNDNYIAKYWKNGVSVNLTDGTTFAHATGIAISGADVYVSGTESSTDFQQDFGKYWKNGVGVIIPVTYPTGIAVTGTDIYISGGMSDSLTGHMIAVYLKNGIPVRLSDGSSDAHANTILADGSDIYIAGDDGNRAVYWKNQVPVYLTDGSRAATLCSIATEGSDVLVAGNIASGGNPGEPVSIGTYWKNGIPVTLGKGVVLSAIATAKDNVYIVGQITLTYFPYFDPGYWINNERQTNIDQSGISASFSQILVVEQ